jgi:hypothetical protein
MGPPGIVQLECGFHVFQADRIGIAGHALDLPRLQARGLEQAPGGVAPLGAQLPVGVALGGILGAVGMAADDHTVGQLPEFLGDLLQAGQCIGFEVGAAAVKEHYFAFMVDWETRLNHFLQTGQLLSRALD